MLFIFPAAKTFRGGALPAVAVAGGEDALLGAEGGGEAPHHADDDVATAFA